MVVSVALAGICFGIWFFVFAGSSLPAQLRYSAGRTRRHAVSPRTPLSLRSPADDQR